MTINDETILNEEEKLEIEIANAFANELKKAIPDIWLKVVLKNKIYLDHIDTDNILFNVFLNNAIHIFCDELKNETEETLTNAIKHIAERIYNTYMHKKNNTNPALH